MEIIKDAYMFIYTETETETLNGTFETNETGRNP